MIRADLELFSTQELVEELIQRTTFQGVVVHCPEGGRRPEWTGQRCFQVHMNANLEPATAGRLLEVVSRHLVETVDD